MRYREFAPGPRASRFVECFWTLDGAAEGTVQRVVPDGRCELILNLREPFEALDGATWRRQPECFLAGQITGPLLLRAGSCSRMIGIRFRPGGVAQLLGVPADELAGRSIDARDLGLGALRSVGSVDEAEQIVLERERGAADAVMDEAVRLLSRDGEVGGAARALGLSTRHLERRFKARVGMSPKHFARIVRFQRVFGAVEGGGSGWVEAAAACGYYDQAHLIRDFRDLAGEAPSHLMGGDELARHFLSHFSKTGKATRA
ncbi:MAG: helix-turn-helix domain-containing protein [Candidatus Solibacter sp.]